MFDDLTPQDKEFLEYMMKQLPVGFLYMSYHDFKVMKKLERSLVTKITESDINRLELKLKLGEFNNFMKGKEK